MNPGSKKLFALGFLLALTMMVSGCADNSEEGAQSESAAESAAEYTEAAAVDSAIDSAAEVVAEAVVEEVPEVTEAPAPMPRHESLEVEYGTYTVQIGSYDSRELAQPFLAKLEAEGLEPYLIEELVTVDGEERLIYRLRFGKYSSKDEAHNRGSEVALRWELDYWVDNYKF